jgi:hypothetical protein
MWRLLVFLLAFAALLVFVVIFVLLWPSGFGGVLCTALST